MSKDVTPEWLRVKRELESLVRGVWFEIGKLWDWLYELEKRVEMLEKKMKRKDHQPPLC